MNKIKAINKVFGELELHVSKFKNESCLSCIADCGACCTKNDINTTVLEFLPAALSIYLSGDDEKIFNQLENHPGSICVLYNPFATKGFCSFYENRGLICRLFGFSTKQDKNGMPSLITCPPIKQSLDPVLLEKYIKDAPDMVNYYMRIHGIDPLQAIEYFPINVSIRKALEIVAIHFEYRKKPA